jgi:hypothetical protein
MRLLAMTRQMGGFADRPADADAELVHRAAREGRPIVFAPDARLPGSPRPRAARQG